MLIIGLNDAPLKGLENFLSYLYENEWREFYCYSTTTKEYLHLYGYQVRERLYQGEMVNGYSFYGNGYYYNENWYKDILFHTVDNGYSYQYEDMRIKWKNGVIYYAKGKNDTDFQGFIINQLCPYIKHVGEATYNYMKNTNIKIPEQMFLDDFYNRKSLVLKLRLMGL